MINRSDNSTFAIDRGNLRDKEIYKKQLNAHIQIDEDHF